VSTTTFWKLRRPLSITLRWLAFTKKCTRDSAKLLYAVSAWWGFSSAADRQRLQALLHRGIRSGLCSPETPTLTELAESIDDTLFQRIMHNPYHVMYHLLPPRRELSYNIRQRHHDRQLNIISGQLRSRNIIYRMLFKDCYWLFFLYFPCIACTCANALKVKVKVKVE